MQRIKKNHLKRSKQSCEPADCEGSSVDVDEDAPKKRLDDSTRDRTTPSGHSTPKRSIPNVPTLNITPLEGHKNYTSGIYSVLTQDKGNEVTWDWHSPVRKSTNGKKKSSDPCGTPKRIIATERKKRLSNSPLLYKPPKRQIISAGNDSLAKFKALMGSVTEQVKNAQTTNKPTSSSCVNNEKIDIPEIIDFEFTDDDDDGDLKPVIVTKNTSTVNNSTDKTKSNANDLFNDSLNEEAMMIRCSQEVEEKLNIVPMECTEHSVEKSKNNSHTLVHTSSKSCSIIKTNTNITVKNNTTKNSSTLVTNQAQSKISTTASTSKPGNSRSMTTKFKSEPITPKSAKKSIFPLNKSKNGNSTTFVESDEYENYDIPDDSFDDFVATCDLTKVDSINAAAESLNSRVRTTTTTKTPTKLSTLLPRNLQKSSLNLTARSNNNNNSNQIYNFVKTTATRPPQVSTVQSNNATDRKFFKSKSQSDSAFGTSNTGKNVTTTTTAAAAAGVGKNNRRLPATSVSTTNAAVHRTTSCLDTNAMRQNSVSTKNTIAMSRVPRSAVKDDGNTIITSLQSTSSTNSTQSSSSSSQLRTAEEIERKRLEAKRKLEAKKLRLQSKSKSDVILQKKTKR